MEERLRTSFKGHPLEKYLVGEIPIINAYVLVLIGRDQIKKEWESSGRKEGTYKTLQK